VILLGFLYTFAQVTLVMLSARLIIATWSDSFIGRMLTVAYA
jgi:hypothetical protein